MIGAVQAGAWIWKLKGADMIRNLRRSLSALLAGALLAGFAFGTPASAIVFSTNNVDFDMRFPALPGEDFDDGNVIAGGFVNVGSPLDSGTDNAVFSPGDIPDFVAFEDRGPDAGQNLALAGAGFSGLASNALFVESVQDTLDILFPNGALAVGLDIVTLFADANVLVTVFGAGDLMIGSDVLAISDGSLTFLGIEVEAFSSDVITRINLNDQDLETAITGIDEVGLVVAGANPAFPILAPGAVLLLGLGLLGLAMIRRRA